MARWQPAERHARFLRARSKGRPVVVSEGDSWFDYPMYLNLIDHVDDTRRFALKRLEFSGDTVRNMVGTGGKTSGVQSLKEVVLAERPRFVLFSGGGNDIVGEEFIGATKPFDPDDVDRPPEWYLETPVWRQLTQEVEEYYVRLIDTIGPLAPVFAHGYDFIHPADKPVKFSGLPVTGPWVWPELAMNGYPDAKMLVIGKAMIDWFNDMLARLEVQYGPKGYFSHLDLRGTLTKGQWENEIHPTRAGFRLIAARFVEQLDSKLNSTLARHDQHLMGGE